MGKICLGKNSYWVIMDKCVTIMEWCGSNSKKSLRMVSFEHVGGGLLSVTIPCLFICLLIIFAVRSIRFYLTEFLFEKSAIKYR